MYIGLYRGCDILVGRVLYQHEGITRASGTIQIIAFLVPTTQYLGTWMIRG